MRYNGHEVINGREYLLNSTNAANEPLNEYGCGIAGIYFSFTEPRSSVIVALFGNFRYISRSVIPRLRFYSVTFEGNREFKG